MPILLVIVCILLAACASPGTHTAADSTHLGPNIGSKTECHAANGVWREAVIYDPAGNIAGTANTLCSIPTPDSGKICRDTIDCKGFCEAPSGAKPGDKVVGTCAPEYQPACFQLVINGYAQEHICS